MKNFLTIMLILLSCISLAKNPTPSTTKTFTIGGRYEGKQQISYELYNVDQDNTVKLHDTGKDLWFFMISMPINYNYIVKFTSKDGQSKYLSLNPTKGGEFSLNVNFKRKNSAKLTYDPLYNTYQLVPVEETPLINERE